MNHHPRRKQPTASPSRRRSSSSYTRLMFLSMKLAEQLPLHRKNIDALIARRKRATSSTTDNPSSERHQRSVQDPGAFHAGLVGEHLDGYFLAEGLRCHDAHHGARAPIVSHTSARAWHARNKGMSSRSLSPGFISCAHPPLDTQTHSLPTCSCFVSARADLDWLAELPKRVHPMEWPVIGRLGPDLHLG